MKTAGRLFMLSVLIYANHDVAGRNVVDREELVRKPRADGTPWSYDSGTYTWPFYYHACAGKQQSPINIYLDEVSKVKFPALKFNNYDFPKEMTLKNNGHSVEIEPASPDYLPYVSGGSLPGTFVMHHIHFHWGSSSIWGSEHTVNHKPYAFEAHIVNFNRKYRSISEAQNFSDGLAVIAVFAEKDNNPNQIFDNIVNSLNDVREKGQKVTLSSPVKLRDLLPSNTEDYFRYHGSLTTPSCKEIVTWTVLRTPIKISEDQLSAFRIKIQDSEGNRLPSNFRPTQPDNERNILLNEG